MDEKVGKVLEKIEEMDKTWERHLSSKEQDNPFNHDQKIRLWCIPRSSGEFLRFLVVASRAKTILELGCSAGYSALWMAMGAQETGGHVYTTEIYKEKIELATQHFQDSGLTNITLLSKDIKEVIKGWDKKLDFVFMDASKKDYLEYYEKILPLLGEGGVIVADNATTHQGQMQPFIDRALSDDRVFAQLLKVDHGLIVIVKR